MAAGTQAHPHLSWTATFYMLLDITRKEDVGQRNIETGFDRRKCHLKIKK